MNLFIIKACNPSTCKNSCAAPTNKRSLCDGHNDCVCFP